MKKRCKVRLYMLNPAKETNKAKAAMLCFGALISTCNRLCHITSQHVEDFIEIKDEIFKLIAKLEMRHYDCRKQPSMSKVVGNLIVVKTKGAPCKKKYGRKRR